MVGGIKMFCKDCKKGLLGSGLGSISIRMMNNGFVDPTYTDKINYCFDCFKAAAGEELIDELQQLEPISFSPIPYSALPKMKKLPKIHKSTYQKRVVPNCCSNCMIAWTPTLFTIVNNLCDNCYSIVTVAPMAMPCTRCGKPLILRINGTNRTAFWGCSAYPVCKKSLNI